LYLQNWGNALNLIPTIFSIGITWSLAIEEQFYMFWPSVVRFLDSKKLGFLAVGLIAFSLVLRLVIVERFRKLLDYINFSIFLLSRGLTRLFWGTYLPFCLSRMGGARF
jgi:peptidoglycan/LPS O-acetylase OafA/YrhL